MTKTICYIVFILVTSIILGCMLPIKTRAEKEDIPYEDGENDYARID